MSTHRIKRAIDVIVDDVAVDDSSEAETRVLVHWKHPAAFTEYCPSHVLKDAWMSAQIYRIAASVSEAFNWSFFESDEPDEDDGQVHVEQVATYREMAQKEVTIVEAHKCTMEVPRDHVLDAAPE